MPTTPRITIVTPSYQQAQYLPATLHSVLTQDYPNLEYIVCDGGSTDGSKEIIQRFASRYPQKLTWWCSEKDGGQTAAINKGFRRATGDIVAWVNSDDIIVPGALQKVAEAFQNPDVKVVTGWGVMIDTQGRVRRRDVFPKLTAEVILRYCVVFQPATFWRREIFDQIGYLDESFRFCMDREYWIRMVQAGIDLTLVPSVLAALRKHPGTKTSTLGDIEDNENELLNRRIFGEPPAGKKAFDNIPPSGWNRRAKLTRLIHEKLLMLCPPFARGQRVHPPIDTLSH